MLNMLWEYWKSKDAERKAQRHKDTVEPSPHPSPIRRGREAQRQRRIEMGGMCIVMVCGWLLLLSQSALATPPLYPGMGGGHKDDVAPIHYRIAEELALGEPGLITGKNACATKEGQERLLAPGEPGIGGRVCTTGTVSVIALMVDFSDIKFSKNISYFKGLMDNLVTYYHDNSYGKLNITYAIATITVGYTMSYYANGGEKKPFDLVNNAVKAADDKVDFRWYDALIVIHAGQGQESNSKLTDIYSQFVYKSEGIVQSADRVGVYGACIVPEDEGSGASPFGIFCHEFGHQLGLPDLYDTTPSPADSEGIGKWSLMSSGAWNGYPQGASPAHLDAWCKMKLDWVMPQTVSTTLTHQPIPQAEVVSVAFKLCNNTMDSKEYFLVENRQDIYLPGKGLLIYHVDERQQTNDDSKHYMVALEQADGRKDLESTKNNRGDAGDPYPGSSGNRYFDNWSNPDSRTYQGDSTYISVQNISDSAGTMTADLSVVSLNINLTSPSNNSILYTGTPTFAWTSIEGVGTYTLRVGTCTFVATTTVYRPALSFEENGSYTWNVMAVTENGTYTSDTWRFWIDAIASPPSVPTLLFPINGQTISQTAPTFKWQASTDPDPGDRVQYILWYSMNSGTKTSSGTITNNSWTSSQNLCDGTYSWNVQAVDTTGNAIWGGTNTFTIQTVKAYPNPLILGTKDEITIEGLPTIGMVNIKIYNIAGELLRDESVLAPDGKWKWNVRNNDNEQVASGIYIYLITGEKDKIVGKIAVIK